MTVTQRPARPSKADERTAYRLCTERDAGRCVRCGSNQGVQRDHRQNRQVGNTVEWNLQLLCGPTGPDGGCHKWKTEHPAEAIEMGYSVPSWADPRATPARRLVFGENRWVVYGTGTTYAVISDREAQVRRETVGIE